MFIAVGQFVRDILEWLRGSWETSWESELQHAALNHTEHSGSKLESQ